MTSASPGCFWIDKAFFCCCILHLNFWSKSFQFPNCCRSLKLTSSIYWNILLKKTEIWCKFRGFLWQYFDVNTKTIERHNKSQLKIYCRSFYLVPCIKSAEATAAANTIFVAIIKKSKTKKNQTTVCYTISTETLIFPDIRNLRLTIKVEVFAEKFSVVWNISSRQHLNFSRRHPRRRRKQKWIHDEL